VSETGDRAVAARMMFRKKLDPAKIDDYITAHDEIWPEVVEDIRLLGMRNFSIFFDEVECEVFGFFEVDDLAEYDRVGSLRREDSVRWQEFMRSMSLDKESPNQGQRGIRREVFYLPG
jgi:L-rhamnose mutarotase